jgi:DNA-binding FadR family transcriptional regulator
MSINYATVTKTGIARQIAEAIREAILEGRLTSDERLPGEQELADRFAVSRPTVREALKILGAQNLIRTQRGPTGGSFVNRIGWGEAHDQLVTTATLLVSMNPVDPREVAEARFALQSACAPLAAERRTDADLAAMRAEIAAQRDPALSDEAFCATDVRFHRAVVDAAGNQLLSFQLAGVIEAMQPLLNMITYRQRDRREIVAAHAALTDALEARDAAAATEQLRSLAEGTARMIAAAQAAKAK